MGITFFRNPHRFTGIILGKLLFISEISHIMPRKVPYYFLRFLCIDTVGLPCQPEGKAFLLCFFHIFNLLDKPEYFRRYPVCADKAWRYILPVQMYDFRLRVIREKAYTMLEIRFPFFESRKFHPYAETVISCISFLGGHINPCKSHYILIHNVPPFINRLTVVFSRKGKGSCLASATLKC